ncbi:hypothetical protein BJI47_17755 [Rhodococcus sp. 1168]|nr:hypothetical protein BJI47_00210 [Rhodococcus sp. 1168]ORI15794.1 hypothetical protein BJI47_01525 [Rhodococcus sp. 1168]ORI20698.1 hypothetical protein BJI47_00785 [Rhodococcus sp. 1168]ORI21263.1 hypothetical protein BJI47_17755 [Rhodococcus sp. 1168]
MGWSASIATRKGDWQVVTEILPTGAQAEVVSCWKVITTKIERTAPEGLNVDGGPASRPRYVIGL